MLIRELSPLSNTIEDTATITKNRDDGYYISINEYGIEKQIEFSSYMGDHWLRDYRGNADWDAFTIEIPLLTSAINDVSFKDKTVTRGLFL